jgi:hypothetical protein
LLPLLVLGGEFRRTVEYMTQDQTSEHAGSYILPPEYGILKDKLRLLDLWPPLSESLSDYKPGTRLAAMAAGINEFQTIMDTYTDIAPTDYFVSNSDARCTQFHLFSELPIELRHSIWQFALPEAKLVNICSTEALNDLGQERKDVET